MVFFVFHIIFQTIRWTFQVLSEMITSFWHIISWNESIFHFIFSLALHEKRNIELQFVWKIQSNRWLHPLLSCALAFIWVQTFRLKIHLFSAFSGKEMIESNEHLSDTQYQCREYLIGIWVQFKASNTPIDWERTEWRGVVLFVSSNRFLVKTKRFAQTLER